MSTSSFGMSRSGRKLLEIYLDDHWAGAAAGRALAHRLYTNNRNTEWGDRLLGLVNQIDQDDRILRQIRDAFGFDGGKAKRYLAMAGERVSRFKPNGRIVSYSPLSRLLECEAMEAGVSAKRSLWAGLSEAVNGAEFNGNDFGDLISRADAQIDLLRSFHSDAAARAFRD
jgi:hypothetical protein